MPLYDVKCAEHGVMEVMLPMNLSNRPICPKCGAPVQRVYSPPALTRLETNGQQYAPD